MAYLTVSEFADEQGVSPSTVRRWIKDGLPSLACGPSGTTCVDVEQAEAWLDELDTDDGEDEGADVVEVEDPDDDDDEDDADDEDDSEEE